MSSQKHSNLQAAKSALGLSDDEPKTSSSLASSSSPSRAVSTGSVLSRDSRSSAGVTTVSGATTYTSVGGSASTYTSTSAANNATSALAAATALTSSLTSSSSSTAAATKEKFNTLHSLSSNARLEARRLSVANSMEAREARLTSTGSTRRSAIGSAVSTGVSGGSSSTLHSASTVAGGSAYSAAETRAHSTDTPITHTGGNDSITSPTPTTTTHPPSPSSRSGSIEYYLDEGSRDDSMMDSWRGSGRSVASGIGVSSRTGSYSGSGGHVDVSSRTGVSHGSGGGTNISSGHGGSSGSGPKSRENKLDESTSSHDLTNYSSLNLSSSNFGMSSSFNNVYERKVGLNPASASGHAGGNTGGQTSGRRMSVVDEDTYDDENTYEDSGTYEEGTYQDSATFQTAESTMDETPLNVSSKKVSFNESLRIVESRQPAPVSSFHSSDDFDEASGSYIEGYNESYNDSFHTGGDSQVSGSQYSGSQYTSEHNESSSQYANQSHTSLVSTDSNNFIPQRFDEMRSLLLNITPLQLEALVSEIFTATSSNSSYLSVNSGNSRSIPPQWKNIAKKSKRYGFRKHAYLGEMSYEELRAYASAIELWSIVDNEDCNEFEVAMDIFAVEFEMLVSGHNNGRNSEGYGNSVDSIGMEGGYGQHNASIEDDLVSYISNASSQADEGENLRRSLRACSVPELRLVAQRLNLDLSDVADSKSDLIGLIESSMPDMLNGTDSNGRSLRENPPPPPPRHDNAAQYVEESHARQQQQQQLNDEDRSRRVKFSTDCKEDTSHLIPKREMNQAVWGNYVVDAAEVEREEDEPLVLYVDEGENVDGARGKKMGLKWPEERRRFIIVGALVSVVLGIALGLGLGLTKDKWQGDGGGGKGAESSTSTIMTGPWTIGFGDFGTSEQPSVSPSGVVAPEGGGVVLNATKNNSTAKSEELTSKPTKKATAKPTAAQTTAPTQQPFVSEPKESGGISSIEILTNSPASAESVDNEGEDFVMAPTSNPTKATSSTPTKAPLKPPTVAPVSSSPTIPPTAGPSVPLYPLLGPFDETGMRMVLNGITELSSMGRTQWKMLTSAFVEQFYNHGEKGDDAIQNIVFDVSADIEITDDEQVTPSKERKLQAGAVILTFTTTISYHTYSAFLDAATVADRPFIDQSMRMNYIEYLMTNNAITYIGNITSISEIFRGNDVPPKFIPPPASSTEEPAEVAVETQAPMVQTPMPSSPVDTPMPSSLSTPEPSIKVIEVLTPRPTMDTESELTPRPTQNSFDFIGTTLSPAIFSTDDDTSPSDNSYDFFGETLSPTASIVGDDFSPARDETPYPTSNAFDWPDETPAPSPIFGSYDTPATNSAVYTEPPSPFPTDIVTSSVVYTDNPITASPSDEPTPNPSGSPRKQRLVPPTPIPTKQPTTPPTTHPTKQPTTPPTTHPTISPTEDPTSSPSNSPSLNPTPNPTSSPTVKPTTPSPTKSPTLCDLVSDENCSNMVEVLWEGSFEIAQTHVVKAVNEKRRAPRTIAQREAELLFTPATSRRLESDNEDGLDDIPTAQRIESVGKVYVLDGNGSAVNNDLADVLLDGSNSLFVMDSPDIEFIIDLKHLRLIEEVSIVFSDNVSTKNVQIGLRYDDGQNTDEQNGIFQYPTAAWLWHDIGSSTELDDSEMSLSISKRKARYISIRINGGKSQLSSSWSLQRVEILGYLDGVGLQNKVKPKTRGVAPRTKGRIYTPSKTTAVRVAVYSKSGRLLGVIDGRDPSKQRSIFESQVSNSPIDPYSDSAWSATLPFNWVEEGNIVMIGCVDKIRPSEVLVHRLELTELAQFSEHSITRTKMAIFGTDEDVMKLNSKTFDGKKLARDLYAVMPVAELKWADTDLWHLPYLVVIGKDGNPVLVNSEEERREATGVGTEINWEVMKNFLTIRHALAQAGLGFALTSKEGNNSPYASHSSVFMGWSLSKQEDDGSWHWEDLGYWDTLAAAAWVGWVAMKAGDECSNYFIHELGHSLTMNHFDNNVAVNWGIEDEYPSGSGIYTPDLPWGYDSVARQFRTWFDPLDGSGKKDPLNGEGEPPYSQELNCFSQYTPYQAEVGQEFAMSTPILLSASTSEVPRDGAYQFDAVRKQYIPLIGSDLTEAVGEYSMTPDQVSIPVVTLIGTIGGSRDVCQTYPPLRGYGNTFEFPDPFEPGLPSAFDGASYFVEIRFASGRKLRGLIAAKDVTDLSLYSFNVAIDQNPIAADLYRFVDGSYPNLSSSTLTQLLHIRPIELPPQDPLQGMARQLRVGRGWLGGSSTPLLDAFCISSEDCESDKYFTEWRGNVGSDHVLYRSTLQGRNDEDLKATVFEVPALRLKDSTHYTITVLVSRLFNDRQGMSPLLTSKPFRGNGSSSIDVTHIVRIWAPWELNKSLPVGFYRSLPDAFKISADALGSSRSGFHHNIIEFNVGCFIGTVTAAPTFAPTKRPSEGPSSSPVQIRYHIDWKHGTCVTDGLGSEWALQYNTKEECCQSHMAYEYNVCISREG